MLLIHACPKYSSVGDPQEAQGDMHPVWRHASTVYRMHLGRLSSMSRFRWQAGGVKDLIMQGHGHVLRHVLVSAASDVYLS